MNGVEQDALLEEGTFDAVEGELLRGSQARLAETGDADRALAKLVVQRFRAGERRRRHGIYAGAALGVAAATTLVWGLRGALTPTALPARPEPATAFSPLLLASGQVVVPGQAAVALGEPIAAGVPAQLSAGACLRAGSSLRLCSERGAKLRLPSLGAPWDIALEAGGVTAELAPMASGFTVRTPHGTASVVGTVFSMSLDASGAFSSVSVARGSVRCHNTASGEEVALAAGERAALGKRLQVFRSERPSEAAVAEPGALVAEAQAPGAGSPAATGAQPPAARDVAPRPTSEGANAQDLLQRAREQRAARRYVEAAQSYRQLLKAFPGSTEARAALVSLGQLELGQLDRPEAALRSFQAYMAHPGTLQQEAEAGAIQALGRLGRKADERRAIEGFLRRYPKSIQAGPLTERLKQL